MGIKTGMSVERNCSYNLFSLVFCQFLYIVSLNSPPRIALPTAGYKGLFSVCKNKVNVVVVNVVVVVVVKTSVSQP